MNAPQLSDAVWLPAGFLQNAVGWLFLASLLAAVLFGLYRSSDKLVARFEEVVFTNWRLALLGVTGVVLSTASGWTTWDGMRNFTGEPVLSFMITFGIQGVMLIAAWLIGETFATGLRTTKPGGGVVSAIAGVFTPYLRVLKIILTNIVLWVMFAACMATSVFFSFDSLFSTIFPAGERERAATLRAQNQVSGLMGELGDTIARQRLRDGQGVFSTPAWTEYSAVLAEVENDARAAESELKSIFAARLAESRQSIATQQERRSTALSREAALRTRKERVAANLSRIEAQRATASSELATREDTAASAERRLEEQRVRVLAEERGVGSTGKAGRGSRWRAEKEKEAKREAELAVAVAARDQRRDALSEIDRSVAQVKSELASLEGQIAKVRADADGAQAIIAAASSAEADTAGRAVNPIDVLPALAGARQAFQEAPTEANLARMQTACFNVVDGLKSTRAQSGQLEAEKRCDAKRVGEAATRVFALNKGLQAFGANCAGPDKVVAETTTTGLFNLLRGCLAASGLSPEATEDLRDKINFAELNRDDKAHRFVVTWNAFSDGNRLAYLALAIAIAIDSLVFMAGLFGANAVSSPLQGVPGARHKSARQLEDIVGNALMPNRQLAAQATIAAMAPIDNETDRLEGFAQHVVASQIPSQHFERVMQVLNAGAAIGAVERVDGSLETARVRPEFFEYLSLIAKREAEARPADMRVARIEPEVADALQPDVPGNARMVLSRMHPEADPKTRYAAIINMSEVQTSERPVVNGLLITGAAHGLVERDVKSGDDGVAGFDHYLIDRILHRALLSVARSHPTFVQEDQSVTARALAAAKSELPPDSPTTVAQSAVVIAPPPVTAPVSPEVAEPELPKIAVVQHPDGDFEAAPSTPTAPPATVDAPPPSATAGPPAKQSLPLNPIELSQDVKTQLAAHFARHLRMNADELIVIVDQQSADEDLSKLLGRIVEALPKLEQALDLDRQTLAKARDAAVAEPPKVLAEYANGVDVLRSWAQRLSAFEDMLLLRRAGSYHSGLRTLETKFQGTPLSQAITDHLDELNRIDTAAEVRWKWVRVGLRRFEAALDEQRSANVIAIERSARQS